MRLVSVILQSGGRQATVPLLANKVQAMMTNTSEIYIKGKWVKVPAFDVDGKTVAVTGRWLKMAVICSEEWLETELANPDGCIGELKRQRPNGERADIFTFTQKLPATLPKYQYSMEWDSVAAICPTSFREWWEKLPQEGRKNVRRSQKRGVAVGVKQFDDPLIRAIRKVNNDSPVRQKV